MRRHLLILLTALLVATAAVPGHAAAAPRPLEIGSADAIFSNPDGPIWARRAARAGTDAIRVNVYWSSVARSEPRDPTSPDDPAYDFSEIDRAVGVADARGLDVLMTVLSAPPFAEGPGRPDYDVVPAGTWRPDPDAFGDFGRALAERYSGDHPDPKGFGDLPEVDRFSAWNEPNASAYLTPQYVNGRNESAAIYVDLLDAFYTAVKGVNPEATITTGGTAPIGDPDRVRRTQPLEFWRRVMCLTPDLEVSDPCPVARTPSFDVLAHHPINYLSSPRVHAGDRDDLLIADFGKLTAALRAAESLGTVLPATRHSLIAPEVWWETKPPEPRGISLRQQSRYTALGLYMLWRGGADGVWFLQLRDSARRAGEGPLKTYQTGFYAYSGRRKPALRAVAFPFVTRRLSARRVLVWGRAPSGGRLRIEVRRGHGKKWKRRASTRVGAHGVFTRKLRLRGNALVRARVGGRRSPVWRQRR